MRGDSKQRRSVSAGKYDSRRARDMPRGPEDGRSADLAHLSVKIQGRSRQPGPLASMAKSKYEYVRTYERDEVALPTTYLVVRIDGKGFHRFSDQHGFDKPNDRRAIDLMNAAARRVMESPAGMEIVLAFGESDEFSFVFNRSCDLFGRRVRCACPCSGYKECSGCTARSRRPSVRPSPRSTSDSGPPSFLMNRSLRKRMVQASMGGVYAAVSCSLRRKVQCHTGWCNTSSERKSSTTYVGDRSTVRSH